MITDIKDVYLSPEKSYSFTYKGESYENIEDAFQGKHLKQEVSDKIKNYKEIMKQFSFSSQRDCNTYHGVSSSVSCSAGTSSSFSSGVSSSYGASSNSSCQENDNQTDRLLNQLFHIDNSDDLNNLFEKNNWRDVLEHYIEFIFNKSRNKNYYWSFSEAEKFLKSFICLYRTKEFISDKIFLHDNDITEEYLAVIKKEIEKRKQKSKKLKDLKDLQIIKDITDNYFQNCQFIYSNEGIENTSFSLSELDENKSYEYILFIPLILTNLEKHFQCLNQYANPMIIYFGGDDEKNEEEIVSDIQMSCYETQKSKVEKTYSRKASIQEFKDSCAGIILKCEKLNKKSLKQPTLISQMRMDYDIEYKKNKSIVNLEKSWCSDIGAELFLNDNSKIQWVIK